MIFGKKKAVKKDFDEWYNGVKSTYSKLQNIIQPGKKLSNKSVNEFWQLFYEAQKEAFEAGQE